MTEESKATNGGNPMILVVIIIKDSYLMRYGTTTSHTRGIEARIFMMYYPQEAPITLQNIPGHTLVKG